MSEYIIPLDEIESAMCDIGKTIYEAYKWREIVRCRDCKHYKPYRTHQHGMMNRCHDEHGHTHKRDGSDFCSRGERREQ